MPLPTKLTASHAGHLVHRERLYQMLSVTTPLVWIWGSAGSGKTALATSWIEHLGAPFIWYQMDGGDRDPANLFYFLRLAAHSIPDLSEELPQFGPEYQNSFEGFLRNFLRRLFHHPASPKSIVFDDCHELDDGAPVFSLLLACLSELPVGSRLIFTSRRRPPADWEPLRWKRQLVSLDEQALRFTPTDIAQAAERFKLNHLKPSGHSEIAAITGGWAAGVQLWLEQASHQGLDALPATPPHGLDDASLELLMDMSLSRMSAPQRQAMLSLSLLPRLSAHAMKAVAGRDIEHLLDSLDNAMHLLTRVGTQRPFEYRMHEVMRACFSAKARRLFNAEQCERWLSNAAQSYEENGLFEEAMQVRLTLGQHEKAAELLLSQASAWYESGRGQQLLSWINRLQAPPLFQAWFLYWQARISMHAQPIEARPAFEQAFHAFAQAGNAHGLYRAWRGYVDTFWLEWGHIQALQAWITSIEPFLDSLPPPDRDTERILACGMLSAMMLGAPDREEMADWVERVKQDVFASDDSPSRLRDGCTLMVYYDWWTGDSATIHALGARLAPLAALESRQSINWFYWCTTAPAYYRLTGELESGLAIVDTAIEAVHTLALPYFEFMLQLQRVFLCLSMRQIDEAQASIQRMGQLLEGGRRYSASLFHYLSSRLASIKGDHLQGVEHARIAYDIGCRIGSPFDVCNTSECLAAAWLAAKQPAQALPVAQASLHAAKQFRSPFHAFAAAMLLACSLIETGAIEEAKETLREWLAKGRESGMEKMAILMLSLRTQNQVFKLALREGIEISFVQTFIHTRHVPYLSTGGACLQWPWPLRLQLMGHFVLSVNGKPLPTTGKTQAKPLEMLHYLAVHGGQHIPVQDALDALWPDAEGDLGRKAFDTTLYRLRKLLGHAELLQTGGGSLSINRAYIGCDLWDLHELSQHILSDAPSIHLQQDLEALDVLCQGVVLEFEAYSWLGEQQHKWAIGIGRAIHRLIQNALASQQYTAVARLAEIGIRLQAQEETLHKALLQAHAQTANWPDFDAALRRGTRLFSKAGRELSADRLRSWAATLDTR